MPCRHGVKEYVLSYTLFMYFMERRFKNFTNMWCVGCWVTSHCTTLWANQQTSGLDCKACSNWLPRLASCAVTGQCTIHSLDIVVILPARGGLPWHCNIYCPLVRAAGYICAS